MTNTIQLQGIGKTNATQVQNLKIGDTVVWNFGHTSKVTGFVKETKAQLVVQFDGDHTRRLAKARLIGIAA
jgi:hypothetical protein